MDFVHDQLFDGRPFRILTVVDQLSRESPLIEVDFAMSGQRVAAALEARTADMPVPVSITVDHGLDALQTVQIPHRHGHRGELPHGRSPNPGTGSETLPQSHARRTFELSQNRTLLLGPNRPRPHKMRLCQTTRGALSRDDCRGTYQPSIGTEIGGAGHSRPGIARAWNAPGHGTPVGSRTDLTSAHWRRNRGTGQGNCCHGCARYSLAG